jgi:hypothetical protein
VFGWTRRVTLARVNPVNPEDTPLNWDTTRAEPLGPPAAPVSGPVIPYQPPTGTFTPTPGARPYYPPPPMAPYPAQVTIQPVARKGITGPQAAILITVLVLVLPTLCCLGAMVLGMIGGGAGTTSTTP